MKLSLCVSLVSLSLIAVSVAHADNATGAIVPSQAKRKDVQLTQAQSSVIYTVLKSAQGVNHDFSTLTDDKGKSCKTEVLVFTTGSVVALGNDEVKCISNGACDSDIGPTCWTSTLE